jgi:protein required for attachment to host cells
MTGTCIVVADAATARFFGVEQADPTRNTSRLVERVTLTKPEPRMPWESAPGRAGAATGAHGGAGPMHPTGAHREGHRVEHDRRFGNEIALYAAAITRGWKAGVVVLIAEPRLLGLMRQSLRDALDPGIELKELAKDYIGLTPRELQDRLALTALIPR